MAAADEGLLQGAASLPECDAAPGSILLDMRCYIADLPNGSTATSVTSRRVPIHVTFRAARPPALSHLCVHYPGADFPAEAPKVVATHADLVLLRVPLNPDALFCASTRYWDYFVYMAHPPRLDLLPNPYPKPFNDTEAALLSLQDGGGGGGGGYVLAFLRNRIPRRDSRGGTLIMTEFDLHLHLYRSCHPDEGWITQWLAVEEPVRDVLVPLPRAVAHSMMYHETDKTVTVGGERGPVAWVDLWRGALLCDMLDARLALRDVPLPLLARGNWDRLLQEYSPSYIRDITVSWDKGSC